MVSMYGMSEKVGLYNYQRGGDQFGKPYSDSKQNDIDAETKRIVTEQYDRVIDLLTEKKHLVRAL